MSKETTRGASAPHSITPHKCRRKGAGKPALYGKPMRRVNVMLDDETLATLSAISQNRSGAIREAARAWAQANKTLNRPPSARVGGGSEQTSPANKTAAS